VCGEPVAAPERKLLTILFADLTGYTALAKTLDPEDVHAFLRPAMTALRLVVEDFGGVVPQVMGDGFMAVFGMPATHEDDAERAVRAAVALRERVTALNTERGGVRIPPLHSGVHTGDVLVAPSREAMGFSVTGDVVNTASRIASLARAGQILVGEHTHELTEHAVLYGPRRVRRVKGKPEGVPAFEVRSVRGGTPAGRVRREVELPFLDRVQATERIRSELREARHTRRARVLIVEGEPGIGKSRLASTFRTSLRGVTWLPGRCPPYGRHLPMFALADGVRWLLQLPAGAWDDADVRVRERAEPLIRGDARRFLRQVRVLTGGDERAAPRPIGMSEPGDASARAVVETLAGRRPVVVELDDLQWADADLLQMLVEVHADPWQGPVLFLGMVRRDPPAELGRLPTIRLDSIPAREMSDLAAAVVGRGLPPDVRDALLERAEGNPLFLQEGARMLVESGALRSVDGEWTLVDRRALARVPESLRALVAARIDGLEPVERSVLQDAAVHGDLAPEQGLEELHGGPVHDVVERLVARDLLIRGDDLEVVRFRHRVVRDVAYDRLAKAERARRHRLVGERLAAHGSGSDPGAAAHHLERAWLLGRTKAAPSGDAGDAAAAARWLIAAGGQAFAHLPAASEELFGRAAAAARAAGDDALLAEALAGRAESAIETGDHPAAARDAGRARRLAADLGRDDLRARALLALGRHASDMSEVGRARRFLEEALALFEAAGDEQGRAWGLQRLSEAARFEPIGVQVELLGRALPLFERAGDGWGSATAVLDSAYLLSIVGGAEYQEMLGRARVLADERDDPRTRGSVLRTEAFHAFYSRRFATAIRLARRARPLGLEAGDRWLEVEALLVEASATAASQPAEAAEPMVAELLAIAGAAGAGRLRALALLAGCRSSLAAGRPVQARRRVAEARRILTDLGAEPEIVEVEVAEAELLVRTGRPTPALEVAARAARRARVCDCALLERWANAVRREALAATRAG
jgi:class 3 adenylate cyclase